MYGCHFGSSQSRIQAPKFVLPALGLSSFGYEIAGYEIARLRVDIVEAT